jgi:hypothetical protein
MGTWYLIYSSPSTSDSLVFSRQSGRPFNWGNRIEIYENGDIIDTYSAKCGNDADIHYYKGTWSLDILSMILSTSATIDHQDKKYKLSTLTKDKLILNTLNTK